MKYLYSCVFLVAIIASPLHGFCSTCVDNSVADIREAKMTSQASIVAQYPGFAAYLKNAPTSSLIALASTEPRHFLERRGSFDDLASAKIKAQKIKEVVALELAKRPTRSARTTLQQEESVPQPEIPLDVAQKALEEELALRRKQENA